MLREERKDHRHDRALRGLQQRDENIFAVIGIDFAGLAPAAYSLVGVLVGAGMQYLFGRALKSERQLAMQKGQAYADFFKAVAQAAQHGRSPEVSSLAADAKVRACIYGSEPVVSCLSAFESAGAKTDTADGRAAIIALLNAMRADIGRMNRALSSSQIEPILFGSLKQERSGGR